MHRFYPNSPLFRPVKNAPKAALPISKTVLHIANGINSMLKSDDQDFYVYKSSGLIAQETITCELHTGNQSSTHNHGRALDGIHFWFWGCTPLSNCIFCQFAVSDGDMQHCLAFVKASNARNNTRTAYFDLRMWCYFKSFTELPPSYHSNVRTSHLRIPVWSYCWANECPCPIWRLLLIGLPTYGASAMTGCVQGACTRFLNAMLIFFKFGGVYINLTLL